MKKYLPFFTLAIISSAHACIPPLNIDNQDSFLKILLKRINNKELSDLIHFETYYYWVIIFTILFITFYKTVTTLLEYKKTREEILRRDFKKWLVRFVLAIILVIFSYIIFGFIIQLSSPLPGCI